MRLSNGTVLCWFTSLKVPKYAAFFGWEGRRSIIISITIIIIRDAMETLPGNQERMGSQTDTRASRAELHQTKDQRGNESLNLKKWIQKMQRRWTFLIPFIEPQCKIALNPLSLSLSMYCSFAFILINLRMLYFSPCVIIKPIMLRTEGEERRRTTLKLNWRFLLLKPFLNESVKWIFHHYGGCIRPL